MRRFASIAIFALTLFVLHSAEGAEPSREALVEKSRSVLAQIDGEFKLPGLYKPVEVLRDRWGIPHIYASDTHDLFYAQGVVAAQDRLFQIDLWRRTASGELAEVLGPEAIDRDRMARLVRYRGDMAAEWAGYGPGAREIATAFTDGINDYIAALGDRLPIEFQLADYKPGRWKPEDVVGRMSGIAMVRNFTSEMARAELIAAVGFEKAKQLLPIDPPVAYELPAGLDTAGMTREVLNLSKKAAEKIRFAPLNAPPGTKLSTSSATSGGGDGESAFDQGSNNWVVAGSRTESGKPILANDPHRTIGLPSLRYLVHLHAPGWNVIGGGEPALPGVAVGHNENIAWGLTIVGTDQADIFVEETHPDDPMKYRVGDDWRSMQVMRESVSVRGENEPKDVTLLFTKHGPVIYEDRSRHRAYSLRWSGAEPGTAGYLGSLALNKAGNWDEFLKAAALWRVPSENLIYADREGNIGWIAAAETPRRGVGLGLLPTPGRDPKNDWQGFLPTTALPIEKNPARGFIGTANANILPSGYDRPLAFEWAPRFRQDRVRAVLAEQPKHTMADSMRLQHDNVSLAAQAIVKLAQHLPSDDTALRPYVELMRNWDGDLALSSQAGALYEIWIKVLQEDFFGSRVPKPQLEILRVGMPTMLRALAEPDAKWFTGDPKAERDALLRRTFVVAIANTKKALGDDVARWSWGKLHTARFVHPMSSLGKAYGEAFDLGPIPRPGDATTANATSPDAQFQQTAGASYRHIFDLADWDRGLATSTPGQSGQPGSPHYGDLLPLWAEGKYFPLKYSRAAVEEATAHRLTLNPAGGAK